MSTNLEYRARERQRKRESRRYANEAKRGRKQRRHFLLEEQRENGKEKYKKVFCTCKVAFLLTRPIVVFHRSPALPSPLSITRFYILFGQTLNIIESFAFSPG